MAKKRETFTLDEELLERLKNVSDKSMIAKAKLVSLALDKLLTEYEPPQSRN